MADTQKRIDELRQKRDDTKRQAKAKIVSLKANVKAAEREQLAAIDRKLRRAESRLRGQARRDDTRRKILIGAAILNETTHNPQFKKWLAGDFSTYLTRDRDRHLFGLDPSADAEPLPDFYPKTLPDGSWGAELIGDTSSLPHVLVGAPDPRHPQARQGLDGHRHRSYRVRCGPHQGPPFWQAHQERPRMTATTDYEFESRPA